MWDNMSYLAIEISRQYSFVQLFLCKTIKESCIYSLHRFMHPDVFILQHSTNSETKIKSLLKKDTWSFTLSPRETLTEKVQKCWHHIIIFQKHSFTAGYYHTVSIWTHWCTRLLLQIFCMHNCWTVGYKIWGHVNP
jgi:hypothetical protein